MHRRCCRPHPSQDISQNFSNGCSHSQDHKHLAWTAGKRLYCLIRIDTNTEQYFPYLYPCCTSRHWNTACSSSCNWSLFALLPEHHLLQAVSYVLLRSSEVTDLSQISVLVIKCSAKWDFEKWISLSVPHYSSPIVSIAESMYETHVGMSLICKLVRHSDHLTELQHS